MSRFNQVLLARIKSYAWHMLGIGLVAALTWGTQEVGLLALSPLVETIAVTFLGELTAQVTKYWNVNREWVKNE